MSEKIQELLAVLDGSERQQWDYLYNYEPRILKAVDYEKGFEDANYRLRVLADLAFQKSNGKIAGKTPIEHIIDALTKELNNET